MDAATMEQYANWLDDLEKSDPKAYAKFMEEMQAKMMSTTTPESTGNPFPTTPEQLQFPGNKVMQPNGVEEKKEGMYVDVKPGFVMKTIEKTSQTKLFVNICTSEHIQIFSKKKQLDENGEEQEGIHVPLSIGPPHEVVDHAQKTSLAVDVAVNPGVLDDCNNDPTFRNFVCELALQYLAEKYKFQCDPQYKLPKLTYRGTLPPPRHYIRKTQTPVIQEVVRQPSPPQIKELKSATMVIFEDEVLMVETTRVPACEGGHLVTPTILSAAPSTIFALVKLPSPPNLEGMSVQANAEYLIVSLPGFYDIVRYLPYPVVTCQVAATLEGTQLLIKLPVDKEWKPQTDSADVGSSPWLLAQALASDTPAAPLKAADRFHVSREDNSSSNTPIQEDEILPEDRFHQKDMMSMHILDQRRRDKEQKAQKSATEHDNRKAEAEAKHAAAQAAGKSWAEMYPDEPETTFLDFNEILNPKPEPIKPTDVAISTAVQWREGQQSVPSLKSSLAFELLD